MPEAGRRRKREAAPATGFVGALPRFDGMRQAIAALYRADETRASMR